MKARVVNKIAIAASPTDVFLYLSELRYHYLWNPPLQRVSPLTTLSLGASYRSTSLLFGKKVTSTNTVTRLQPNRELELQNDTGILQYRVDYRLQAEVTATLLTCTTTVSSDSKAFAFAKPILKLLAQRELQVDLALLKTAVEQRLE